MREQGWTRLPRYCQEAVLVHRTQAGADIDLQGFTIDPETATRFAEFLATLKRHAGRPELLSQAMNEQFGDSYFHYYYSRRYEEPREGTDQ
jgi:hypothetical protein